LFHTEPGIENGAAAVNLTARYNATRVQAARQRKTTSPKITSEAMLA
jgi:hypothetical protein